jgi:hypothetical protein
LRKTRRFLILCERFFLSPSFTSRTSFERRVHGIFVIGQEAPDRGAGIPAVNLNARVISPRLEVSLYKTRIDFVLNEEVV